MVDGTFMHMDRGTYLEFAELNGRLRALRTIAIAGLHHNKVQLNQASFDIPTLIISLQP